VPATFGNARAHRLAWFATAHGVGLLLSARLFLAGISARREAAGSFFSAFCGTGFDTHRSRRNSAGLRPKSPDFRAESGSFDAWHGRVLFTMEEMMTAAVLTQESRGTRTKRILMIDDDPTATMLLTKMLERQGHETTAVNDSRLALQRIRQFEPDVILLDINMPIFSGYQIARAVQGEPSLRHIPIVAVTSLDDDEHLRRSLEVGIGYQITKPFHTEELCALIEQLTER
jgi:CheY-like chemotaxis protein